MNKRQKLVQEQFLDDEEKVIKRLKQVYGQSLKDINSKISNLDSSIAMLQKAYASIDGDDIGDLARAVLGSKKNFTPEEAQETLQSMIQSKVYQKKYQKALQKQVGDILDTMHKKEFKAVSDYLKESYENGFIGTMFDLQGQGIPMCFPLDQEAMVRAVQLDSKISKGLYTRLGEDVALLKKKITAQVSRGIATGMSFQQVAQQLAGYTNIGYNNAIRIARTEGHRIQVQSAMDACYKAKDKGADVVKQWDSTLDDRTRESHAAVDGEIRELDEKFSNGLMYPGDPSGGAAEVVNCRCALLQRARWALDEDELETLKERAEYFGLDKADTFDDYKEKYLKAADTTAKAEKDDHPVKNKFGDTIIFDEKMNSEKWSESVGYIKGLADEYETRLTAVKVGAKQAAGTVDMGGLMRLSSSDPATAFHEFAHSISMENLTKVGLVDDSEFWKEIRKVRTKYRKDIRANPLNIISTYADSGDDISEFMAEAFTHAKMHKMGIPLPNKYGTDFTYSDQVLEIIDKYFGKTKIDDVVEEVLENSVKSARVFVPATNKTEAIDYAKRFKVDADYSKYNLDVANSINETMSKIEDTFGSKALDQLHRIGTFPQGYSSRYKGAYVRASDPDLDGSLWLRNVGTKNALEKLESVAKEAFEAGEWSTPEALHTIRHELGHAIHRAIETPEINAQLTALRKSIVDERMKRHRQGDHNHKYSDWLSEYGMTNTKEFVAESVAEYLAGNPRETAAKVVEILIGGK